MPPDWLLWLLPVPLATAAAIGWAAWRGRSRGPQDTAQGVAAYERFRAAMAPPPRDDRDQHRPDPSAAAAQVRAGVVPTRGQGRIERRP